LGDPKGFSLLGDRERIHGRAINKVRNNGIWEYITMARPRRESEEPIVVRKQSNVCGAKGLYFKHVLN